MNQKLFNFLSDNGFTATGADYEEIKNILQLNHCSKNERAFLDEIREKGFISELGNLCIPNGCTIIWKSDFNKSNLSELVEGEG